MLIGKELSGKVELDSFPGSDWKNVKAEVGVEPSFLRSAYYTLPTYLSNNQADYQCLYAVHWIYLTAQEKDPATSTMKSRCVYTWHANLVATSPGDHSLV